MGNDNLALTDFESGLRELDKERASIINRDLRGTFYDTEPELFSESIALLLRRSDTAGTFSLSDAARARSVSNNLASAFRCRQRRSGN